MVKARGEPGARRRARRVREGAPGNGPSVTTKPRPRAYLTPWRSAILLTGGDKSGDWEGWYRRAIPHAEELYAEYLKEREAEEGR